MRLRIAIFPAVFALTVGVATAAPIQRSGYVQNIAGEQCWYDQVIERKAFLHSIPANTAVMTFRKPSCMKAEGLAKDVNAMMINNLIGRWYYQSDVNFMTRYDELKKTSDLQRRGLCMQSRTYPSRALAIFYDIKNGNFAKVFHAMAIQGCK